MRILNNLVGNAIKFTDENGKVIIKSRKIKDFVEISVIDNGKGIPKDKLKNIFDKFYQVDPTLTKSTPGTGLGLSIVKNIVDMHKGNIRVESEEGKGSTFTFTISTNLKK
jgi:signal transduction histidine kinase